MLANATACGRAQATNPSAQPMLNLALVLGLNDVAATVVVVIVLVGAVTGLLLLRSTTTAAAGVDLDALHKRLQDEGAASFVKSWSELMECASPRAQVQGRSQLKRDLSGAHQRRGTHDDVHRYVYQHVAQSAFPKEAVHELLSLEQREQSRR